MIQVYLLLSILQRVETGQDGSIIAQGKPAQQSIARLPDFPIEDPSAPPEAVVLEPLLIERASCQAPQQSP
jgi:hypothetical protein